MARAQDVTKQAQLQYPRVKKAFDLHENKLREELNSKLNAGKGMEIILSGYKWEKQLEVWVSPSKGKAFQLFRTYTFCTLSGQPGPKRKEGDYQVPEGFYFIDRFNPASNFHLSLGINYPNASDKVLSDKKKPGGDIFIHGDCVSVGCIPITDDLIRELYVLCVMAADGGQKNIPVYLFPFHLTQQNLMESLLVNSDKELHSFWQNLQTGYDLWISNRLPLRYSVDASGKYVFKKS